MRIFRRTERSSRQSVDEQSLVPRRKMPTAEEVEDNLSWRSVEETKDEEVTREFHTRRELEEGTDRFECRYKYCASEDRRDELCVPQEAFRDEFSEKHGDQRDGLRNTREGQRNGVRTIREVRKTDGPLAKERHANDRRIQMT